MKNSKGKIPIINSSEQYLIWLFLKNPNDKNFQWAKEIKVAKKLLFLYKDINFWSNLEIEFKLNSLCWFLTYDGSQRLKTEFNKYNLTIPAKIEYIIDKQKYGEDISFEKKMENIIEFLN